MRRASHVDASQTEIVDALRGVGASVVSLASVGQGCPDLLVGYAGENLLLECKSSIRYPDRKSPRRGRLSKRQIDWHEDWRGRVITVWTVEDALRALGHQVN